jgi:hypothetical protein
MINLLKAEVDVSLEGDAEVALNRLRDFFRSNRHAMFLTYQGQEVPVPVGGWIGMQELKQLRREV